MGHSAVAQGRTAGPVRYKNGVLRSGHLLVVNGSISFTVSTLC